MTTLEALDIAIVLLREKRDMDRSVARIVQNGSGLAPHVDGHAVRRYQRHMQAIALLDDLKRDVAAGPRPATVGSAEGLVPAPLAPAPTAPAKRQPRRSKQEVQP